MPAGASLRRLQSVGAGERRARAAVIGGVVAGRPQASAPPPPASSSEEAGGGGGRRQQESAARAVAPGGAAASRAAARRRQAGRSSSSQQQEAYRQRQQLVVHKVMFGCTYNPRVRGPRRSASGGCPAINPGWLISARRQSRAAGGLSPSARALAGVAAAAPPHAAMRRSRPSRWQPRQPGRLPQRGAPSSSHIPMPARLSPACRWQPAGFSAHPCPTHVVHQRYP